MDNLKSLTKIHEIEAALTDLVTRLDEGAALVVASGDAYVGKIFAAFARDVNLAAGIIQIAVLIAEGGNTTPLHQALDSANELVVWAAALSILQWAYSAGRWRQFRAISDRAEILSDLIVAARTAIPDVKVAAGALS